jgi:hypothetical protein
MPDLFGWEGDPDPGRRRRRKGMSRAARRSGIWFELALATVHRFPTGWVGKGEDLRFLLMESLGKPHHCNVWGSLVFACEKKGWLEKTGHRGQMRDSKSHARSTDVLRRTVVR